MTQDGEVYGALSNGCVENEIVDEAAAVFATGEPKLLRYGVGDGVVAAGLLCGGEILVYLERLAPEFIDDLRAACGRATDFFIETSRDRKRILSDPPAALRIGDDTFFDPEAMMLVQRFAAAPHLVLLGAGDITEAIAVLGRYLGYAITLVDPRVEYVERYADRTRYDTIIHAWPQDAITQIPLRSDAAVVSLFHEQRFEIDAIAHLLKDGVCYVGALGSRRVQRERLAVLRERGLSDEMLRRLHAPVGLDIGASAPKEIALAILSEIVAARNARGGGQLKDASGPISNVAAPERC